LRDHDKFGESLGDLCTGLITDVECIMHENEERKTLLEQQMEETAKSFEQCKHLML